MNITVEEISSIKKKIHVEIPGEQVSKEVETLYKEVGKQAKIKGFRPGKVPRDILERYFKDYVKAEVIQKLIGETYPAALSERDLHPVSPPVIDPGDLEQGKSFLYSATIEVKPDINIDGYIGLNLTGKKESVTEEELEERLKGLQELHAQLRTISEPRAVRSGDFVLIDYTAWMDNKPLDEGKATDFHVEIGSGRFIPALEEKLIGLNVEEEKQIEVPFPEDYGYKKWAGKTVCFHTKIKEIKEKVLPALDDEFAKDVGDYSTLEDLKGKLKEGIEKEKQLMFDRQLKDQIVDQLIQSNSFEVPESLIVEQTKALIADTKMRLATQGVTLNNLNIPEEKLQEDYRDVAQRQVRTYLILEKIAEQEGITVTDGEADEKLRSISEKTHQKLDVVKRYYEQNGLIPELKSGILTDKTLDFLLKKANISDS